MKRNVLLLIAISLLIVLGAAGVLLHLGYLLPTWITWERKEILCTEASAPDTIILRHRTVWVLQDGTEVWQSDDGVMVQNVLWEDIDHDDEPELMLLCWKRGQYGNSRPFWVTEDPQTWSQHIHLYDWTNGEVRPIWMASDLGMEVEFWSFHERNRLLLTDQNDKTTAWDWITWGLSHVEPTSLTFAAVGDNLIHRPIYDYVVRLMFRLAREEGYGAQRIANHLHANGIKNRSGKNWHPASIQGILKNPMYTGILRSGKTRSPVQEHLRIIDDATFQAIQKMLAIRSNQNEKFRSAPLNTKGQSLLSGNVFCGHCGARLCITTNGKGQRKKDGSEYIRMRYMCQTKSRTHGECDGQTGYTVGKLDAIIDAIVRNIFSRVKHIGKEDVVNACYAQETSSKRAFVQGLQKEVANADHELEKLRGEIVKSLTGQSAFTPELLSNVIKEQESRCAELRGTLSMAEIELKNYESQMSRLTDKYETMLAWSVAYEHASMSAKKVIVSQMIDRVDVYRNYELKLRLNISVEQFLVSLEGFESTAPKKLAADVKQQAI